MPPPPAPPMADQPESHPGFSSIQVPDLVAMVEAQLQDAILEGRIALGERIVEADLARRMGISRAPVREAARRLESTGLLVARPRHGFAVRDFTLQQVDDLYQVRITLEGMGARLACRHATDSDCAALLAYAWLARVLALFPYTRAWLCLAIMRPIAGAWACGYACVGVGAGMCRCGPCGCHLLVTEDVP